MTMKRMHIIGRKNQGKTQLVVELVEELASRGLCVGTIKHTHHRHELDVPGKDSHRHRIAGAAVVGVLSRNMTAVFVPCQKGQDRYSIPAANFAYCDLVLVEGDSQTAATKIEVWRATWGWSPSLSTTRPFWPSSRTIHSSSTASPLPVPMYRSWRVGFSGRYRARGTVAQRGSPRRGHRLGGKSAQRLSCWSGGEEIGDHGRAKRIVDELSRVIQLPVQRAQLPAMVGQSQGAFGNRRIGSTTFTTSSTDNLAGIQGERESAFQASLRCHRDSPDSAFASPWPGNRRARAWPRRSGTLSAKFPLDRPGRRWPVRRTPQSVISWRLSSRRANNRTIRP